MGLDRYVTHLVERDGEFGVWRHDGALLSYSGPGDPPLVGFVEDGEGHLVLWPGKVTQEQALAMSTRIGAAQQRDSNFGLVIEVAPMPARMTVPFPPEGDDPYSWVFDPRRQTEDLFRLASHPNVVLCGEFVDVDEEDIVTDLADQYNMGFKRWYELVEGSGLSFVRLSDRRC